jgi:hypothetical protein
MLKTIESLAVNDWVLLESLITSRIVGSPYQVTKIAGSRVYLVRYYAGDLGATPEIREEKYVSRRSIRFVFTTEESAEAVSGYARQNSDEYESKYRALQQEYRDRFANYIAGAERNAQEKTS